MTLLIRKRLFHVACVVFWNASRYLCFGQSCLISDAPQVHYRRHPASLLKICLLNFVTFIIYTRVQWLCRDFADAKDEQSLVRLTQVLKRTKGSVRRVYPFISAPFLYVVVCIQASSTNFDVNGCRFCLGWRVADRFRFRITWSTRGAGGLESLAESLRWEDPAMQRFSVLLLPGPRLLYNIPFPS